MADIEGGEMLSIIFYGLETKNEELIKVGIALKRPGEQKYIVFSAENDGDGKFHVQIKTIVPLPGISTTKFIHCNETYTQRSYDTLSRCLSTTIEGDKPAKYDQKSWIFDTFTRLEVKGALTQGKAKYYYEQLLKIVEDACKPV